MTVTFGNDEGGLRDQRVPLEDDRGADAFLRLVAAEGIVEAEDADARRRVGLAQRREDRAQVLRVARARRGHGLGHVGRRGAAGDAVGQVVAADRDEDEGSAGRERADVRALDEREDLGRLHPVDGEVRDLGAPLLAEVLEHVDPEALSGLVARALGQRVADDEDAEDAVLRGGGSRGRGRGREAARRGADPRRRAGRARAPCRRESPPRSRRTGERSRARSATTRGPCERG